MIEFSKYVWALSCVALLGCSSEGGGDHEISDQTLQGTINAADWTFVSGFADDLFGDGELWIELYAVAPAGGDPCSFSAYSGEASIILSVAPDPIDVELSLSTNITFNYEDDGQTENDIGTEGRLIVDKSTDDTIGGGLYAVFESSEVDGNWEVPICP